MENMEKEKLVDQHVAENNTSAAVKLLFELIVEAVEKNDFNKAHTLREKIIEIDAMALDEIIKSGELIEAKKTDAIDKHHLQNWSALYDRFTAEESNAFFFATEALNIPGGKIVLGQGKPNGYLYLVSEGTLKMYCNVDGKDRFVQHLRKGQFFGDDTFLSIQAFCSVSVETETNAKIRRLSKKILRDWSRNFPGIYNKIEGYINTTGSTHELIRAMNLKRRSQNRIPLEGNGRFQLFDHNQKKMGNPFKGTLIDVSSGGMCFVIRMSKRETARLLVGKKVNAHFKMIFEKKELEIDQSGIIISVRVFDLTDYSIHMKFDEKIGSLKDKEGDN